MHMLNYNHYNNILIIITFVQRIASSTRAGGPDSINLKHYVETLDDSESGLTYPALTGQRQQSVSDAERLFSIKLMKFMERKGYKAEARYIKVVITPMISVCWK